MGNRCWGSSSSAGVKVETRPFVTGLVLAGFMDDWGYRQTAMLQHKRTFAGYPVPHRRRRDPDRGPRKIRSVRSG